jgi:hypothetical protein
LIAFLVVRIALLGRGDDRGINDLPAHRQRAGISQRRVESLEQGVDGVRLLQRLAERPDRIGVRDCIGKTKAEKTHERQAVLDQIFAALVRQRIHRLQDQDLEHEHMIEGRAPAFRTIRAWNRSLQCRAEYFEIDESLHPLEIVALADKSANRSSTSKKPGIHSAMSALPLRHDPLNQLRRDSHRVFGGVQLLKLMMWTASPERHQSAKAWSRGAPQ